MQKLLPTRGPFSFLLALGFAIVLFIICKISLFATRREKNSSLNIEHTLSKTKQKNLFGYRGKLPLFCNASDMTNQENLSRCCTTVGLETLGSHLVKLKADLFPTLLGKDIQAEIHTGYSPSSCVQLCLLFPVHFRTPPPPCSLMTT